jgi:uncharacterized protein (TIGR02300 family)
MSKPARGTKRVCPSCGARFYDLGRSPITCPVCEAVYQISPPSRRSERAAPAPAEKPKVEETDTPVLGGAEVISLDEAEEAEEAAVEDEEIADLGGDDDDIPASDDDDDTFLEEDEEGDEDVSGIVKGSNGEE